MIFLRIFLILTALAAFKADQDSNIPSEDDYVFVLKEKNFDQFIENNEFTVVFFYAPWCGHCVSMKPFYHEAAKLLREDESIKSDKPVVFAKVDATAEPELASKHHIQGYPTLKIFRKGVPYEYEGPRREAKDIVNYLVKEASHSWKPPVSQVKVLTNSNFTEWVESHDLSLVEFYSPGCGYCIQLAPNYEKAAKILAENENPIPLAKVDATAETELSQKYKISGYPTLLIFRKGRHYDYKGGRQVNDIVSTMLKARMSTSKEVNTLKQFVSNVLKPTETYVLGLFDNKEDHFFQIFSDFASQFAEDVQLFHSFNHNELLESLGNQNLKIPSILVYYHDLAVPKKEPRFRVFDQESPTFDAVENFIFRESLPLVSHMTPKTQKLIFNKIKPACYVIYDIDIELRPHLNNLRDKVGNVARKFKDIRFVLVNETDNIEYVKSFNLEEETDSDTNLVCVNEKSKVFIFKNEEDSLDESEVSKFVQKFLSGKLKPFIRSEKPKKQDPKNPVKLIVGRTFEEMVTKSKKDVVLGFTGLSNQQTEKFETEFSKLAKQHSSKGIVFGKIDMFKNDFPDSYKPSMNKPTVYYVPAGGDPIEFNDGDKSLKDFIDENMKKFYEKNEL